MAGFLQLNLLWTLLTLPLGLVSFYLYCFRRKSKLDLKGKVVFITGATSGLGKECAIAFYKAGCKVILSGRSEKKLQDVRKELLGDKSDSHKNPGMILMDLEDLTNIPNRMQKALDLFGGIDILINNGGMSYRGLACNTGMNVYQKVMTVNFFSQCLISKVVILHMMKKKSGCIVAISSIQGLIGIPNRTAYTASKHALEGYFESLRAELSMYNIDVCVITPSYIKTNLSVNAILSDGTIHGRMDKNTENGMEPSYVAQQIVDCVVNREEYRLVCPFYFQLAVCLKTMAPSIYFKIMDNKSKKEFKEYLQEKEDSTWDKKST